MSDNPYEAPQSEAAVVGVLSGQREDLKKVATYQKGILICILVYLLAVFGQFLLPAELRIFVMLAVLAVGLVATAFVILLATKVYNMAVGVMLAILTLIPCVGLIALLIINSKATSILKQNGLHVGLLGADLSKI